MRKYSIMIAMSAALFSLTAARAQDPTPQTAGSCDTPYPDAQGNVTFTCRGLSDDQFRLLPDISTLVQKILRSGADSQNLEMKMDQMVNVLRQTPPPTVDVKKAANPEPVAPATTAPPAPPKEVITYDYRGFKTSSLTGPMIGDDGESGLYREMLALQKASEWKKLLKQADREIKKVPTWLTPYAFRAVALRHLGKEDEAIKVLEYVDEHSTGNPDYDQVRNLLKQLERNRAAAAVPAPPVP